jgi:hypothetical protein
VACVDHNDDWKVTTAVAVPSRGQTLCNREFPGSRFSVPPNGYRNWQLAHAKHAGSSTVWLNYAKVGRHWLIRPRASALR